MFQFNKSVFGVYLALHLNNISNIIAFNSKPFDGCDFRKDRNIQINIDTSKITKVTKGNILQFNESACQTDHSFTSNMTDERVAYLDNRRGNF